MIHERRRHGPGIDPSIWAQFPHYADPGEVVQYMRRLTMIAPYRWAVGLGLVEFEWIALDATAVKVRRRSGTCVNLIPELGDKIHVVEGVYGLASTHMHVRADGESYAHTHALRLSKGERDHGFTPHHHEEGETFPPGDDLPMVEGEVVSP